MGDSVQSVQFDGEVTQKRINIGSKSEHDAVMLVTARGEFKLRKAGGHPFSDPGLQALIGQRVRVTGVISAGQLIASRIDPLPSS